MNDIKQREQAQGYSLLLLLILAWGFSWPIAKIGLGSISPIWFSAGRLISATIMMFILTAILGKLRKPCRKDIKLILIVGLVQMAFFQIMINIGLAHTEASRASILAYMTPFFVTPIAIKYFNESFSRMKLTGLIIGFVGILVMFNPLTFDWSNTMAVIGNICLLAAAVSMGLPMLYIRYTAHSPEPLVLFPWQLLVGCVPVILLGLITEPHPHITWNFSAIGAIAYCGIIATAFGYWSLIMVSRNLPVITSSVGLLSVPLIGIGASSMILGEKLTLNLVIAILLITTGLVLIALSNMSRRRRKQNI